MAPRPVRATAIDVVVATLSPFLGENMARAAVRGHKEKLNLHPNLHGSDLDRLIEALGPGLSVFVGRERTREISDAIREAVSANGSTA